MSRDSSQRGVRLAAVIHSGVQAPSGDQAIGWISKVRTNLPRPGSPRFVAPGLANARKHRAAYGGGVAQSVVSTASRPIANRPQVSNLPHKNRRCVRRDKWINSPECPVSDRNRRKLPRRRRSIVVCGGCNLECGRRKGGRPSQRNRLLQHAIPDQRVKGAFFDNIGWPPQFLFQIGKQSPREPWRRLRASVDQQIEVAIFSRLSPCERTEHAHTRDTMLRCDCANRR
jgi:hypothetical protein